MAELDPAQRQAVEHEDGPLLILAGAGSGKTRVITERIASLVLRGADPRSIAAVSFTNKAANEMAQRMIPLVGKPRAAALRMSTFHSFGLALLKEERRAAGLDGRFVIFDQADSMGVVREILREGYHGAKARRYDPAAVLARISNWKSAMVAADGVGEAKAEYDAMAREIYPEYVARMEAMRALDFDDLVCRPVALLRSNDAIRKRWRRRIAHLLVDEFQDTSKVQLELVKLLANEKRNVCVVGDDDQSIYSWRGANVGNILEFESHFPGARLIKLETNYRSRGPILEVANAVIAASGARRHAKTLKTAREGGEAVRRCTSETPRAEAEFVAKEIAQLRREGRNLADIGVLYRSNRQSRPIEEELATAGIPCRVHGGQQFFDRKEVKDVAAYLRFVVNPADEISLRRVINYPTRGVGTRSVLRIEEHAKARGWTFVRAFERASGIEGLPDAAQASLRNLRTLFDEARERLDSSGALRSVAGELVERIGLRRALDDPTDQGNAGEHRYRNVLFLLDWLERYESRGPRGKKSLQEFLQRVTLQGDRQEEEDHGAAVTLCTLHAAKGLEFDVVFLIGCVEGQLPHTRTTDPRASAAVAGDLDEERRLFYVGITRARNRLYLCAPRRNVLRGKSVEVTQTRFMDQLPAGHVEDYEREDDRELSIDELSNLAGELRRKTYGKQAPAR